MTLLRRLLYGLAALVIAFGVGWAAGSSGRRAAEDTAEGASLRLALSDARGRVLAARVSLYNVNFGDASSLFESAKESLGRARRLLQSRNGGEQARSVDAVFAHVNDAQALAGKLDPAAHAPAGEAVRAIDELLRALGPGS